MDEETTDQTSTTKDFLQHTTTEQKQRSGATEDGSTGCGRRLLPLALLLPCAAAEHQRKKSWWMWWKRQLPNIDVRINETVDNSLAASQHILELCQEMNQMGLEVIHALEVHLEKLDNIERLMERINESMHEAEEDLGKMEKCCGLFTLPWKRVPDYEETEDYKEAWMKAPDPSEFVNTVGPPEFVNNIACKHPGPPPKGPFFDSIDPNDPREGEIEANLQEASKILITIRKKVVDIAAELELQEKNLPLVAQKAISLEQRVKLGTDRANVILTNEDDST